MDFNITSEDRVHKFTMNIPLIEKPEIDRRAKLLEFNNLKDYFIELARMDRQYNLLHRPVRFSSQKKLLDILR